MNITNGFVVRNNMDGTTGVVINAGDQWHTVRWDNGNIEEIADWALQPADFRPKKFVDEQVAP